MIECDIQGQVIKVPLLPLPPWITCYGDVAAISLRHSSSPPEKCTWRETEVFYQQPAPAHYASKWAILEVDSPIPIKPADDCRPGCCLNCYLWNPEPKPTELSHAWIPDPQKLYKIMNACCDLKPLCFLVICSATIAYTPSLTQEGIIAPNSGLSPWPYWTGILGEITSSLSPLIYSIKKKFHNREVFLLKSLSNSPTVSNRIGFKWTFLYFSTCQGSCEA